jgi:hypothetical protein
MKMVCEAKTCGTKGKKMQQRIVSLNGRSDLGQHRRSQDIANRAAEGHLGHHFLSPATLLGFSEVKISLMSPRHSFRLSEGRHSSY